MHESYRSFLRQTSKLFVNKFVMWNARILGMILITHTVLWATVTIVRATNIEGSKSCLLVVVCKEDI